MTKALKRYIEHDKKMGKDAILHPKRKLPKPRKAGK